MLSATKPFVYSNNYICPVVAVWMSHDHKCHMIINVTWS